MYHTYDGNFSTVSFPDLATATEWMDMTQRLKHQMDDIVDRGSTVEDVENVVMPRVVVWLRLYIAYLRHWGENMVAIDVRRAAENSNANLPENLRVEIPTEVRGTVRDCTMRVLAPSDLFTNDEDNQQGP